MGGDRPLGAWALPVYGSLVGALLGLGVGYFPWQLFAHHSDAVCFAPDGGWHSLHAWAVPTWNGRTAAEP